MKIDNCTIVTWAQYMLYFQLFAFTFMNILALRNLRKRGRLEDVTKRIVERGNHDAP